MKTRELINANDKRLYTNLTRSEMSDLVVLALASRLIRVFSLVFGQLS